MVFIEFTNWDIYAGSNIRFVLHLLIAKRNNPVMHCISASCNLGVNFRKLFCSSNPGAEFGSISYERT